MPGASQAAGRFQARLRAVLDPLPAGAPAIAAPVGAAAPATAAVLVLLLAPEEALDSDLDSLHVVLTLRRANLGLHAGEVSFPGGRPRSADETLLETALRETHEEIGLAPREATILGALAPTLTRTSNIAIQPYVGILERRAPWTLAPAEVDSVLEPSLAELRASSGSVEVAIGEGRLSVDAYVAGGQVIWGATARIVRDLLARTDGPATTPSPPAPRR